MVKEHAIYCALYRESMAFQCFLMCVVIRTRQNKYACSIGAEEALAVCFPLFALFSKHAKTWNHFRHSRRRECPPLQKVPIWKLERGIGGVDVFPLLKKQSKDDGSKKEKEQKKIVERAGGAYV